MSHAQLFPKIGVQRSLARFFRPNTVQFDPVHVGLDLDGCFFGFDQNYYDAAVMLGHLSSRTPYVPAQTWHFYRDTYGQTGEEFGAICNEAADRGILFAAGYELEGGFDAWDNLARAGHFIHIKTARAFGTHEVASQVATFAWLNANRRTYNTVMFTHDKTAGPPVEMMLEDNLDNYDQLDAAGVEVWLFDQPWNQDDGSRRRVYSHAEFVVRVDAFARKRDTRLHREELERREAQAAADAELNEAVARHNRRVKASDKESDLEPV